MRDDGWLLLEGVNAPAELETGSGSWPWCWKCGSRENGAVGGAETEAPLKLRWRLDTFAKLSAQIFDCLNGSDLVTQTKEVKSTSAASGASGLRQFPLPLEICQILTLKRRRVWAKKNHTELTHTKYISGTMGEGNWSKRLTADYDRLIEFGDSDLRRRHFRQERGAALSCSCCTAQVFPLWLVYFQLLSVIRTSNISRPPVCFHPGRIAVGGSAGFCAAAPVVVVVVLLQNSN